ncbi:class I SAM-dependent methyltransferase [Streptomyces sp. DSM 118878]
MNSDAAAHPYDSANIVLRVVKAFGWTDLLCLGYCTISTMPMMLLGRGGFHQRQLVNRSIRLLRLTPGDRVLDTACGTGYTSDLMARQGCSVTGVDLLEHHVRRAGERYASHPDVRFFNADATNLKADESAAHFGDAAFDKVHCLQGAFQFGPDGRRRFLEEAYRVLTPGGRLVLVDFFWHTERPEEITVLDPERLVRNTWQFEEFEPLHRYRRLARETGFTPRAAIDWTRPVLHRTLHGLALLARLARSSVGRKVLVRLRPSLSSVEPAQWERFVSIADAHAAVRDRMGYAAVILDKPA